MRAEEKQQAEGFLFTDQYQLTMAQLYYRAGIHENEARFEHFFRTYPNYGSHQAGYCINAGLAWLLDWMREAACRRPDVDYLRTLTGRSGERVFADDFLDWLLRNGSFGALRMEAVPEGRVVHPGEPLHVVEGPLALAQVLETSLLNHLNYQTLVATKASRIRAAGRGRLLIEFGLRRGQERGAHAGSRAALVGGADFTSNVGLSRLEGLPPKGTHAHSMVEAFMALGGGELDAFRAYAEVYPDDCLLLVDTVDTLGSGLPNAIRVFEELRRRGREPMGIRLDSGDLAYLSMRAAAMLNHAGFPDAKIVLSNQLDELVLWQIIAQIEKEARRYGVDADDVIERLVYGVGTRLIVSRGDAALDGVYKLVAIRKEDRWRPALKLSEDPGKRLNPGRKQVWRIYDEDDLAQADLIGGRDEDPSSSERLRLHHPTRSDVSRTLEAGAWSRMEPLLRKVMAGGRETCERPSLEQIRATRDQDLDRLHSGVRRIVNPHEYHVSLSEQLWRRKRKLVRGLQEEQGTHAP